MLKVGVIQEITEHPDADKLYVLKVDVGSGKKLQLVAGLRPYYKKDELLGKKIVVASNLKHAKLRGYESQGMILVVGGVDSPFSLLKVDEVAKEGSSIK